MMKKLYFCRCNDARIAIARRIGAKGEASNAKNVRASAPVLGGEKSVQAKNLKYYSQRRASLLRSYLSILVAKDAVEQI